MCEGVGVHGEMDGEMIFESIVGIDLLLDMEERGFDAATPPPVMIVSEEGPCSLESWRERNFKNKDLIFTYTNNM